MSKTVKVIVLLALALGVVQAAVAEESQPPKGAKALFGEGNEEVFFPRQQGGGGSAEMNPTSQVTETMLTSFYKKPEFPGIAYSMEVIRAGEAMVKTVEDPRSYEFRTGDRVRIRLVPNFTGHAYVMEAKQGSSKLIYPASFGTTENQVIAGRETYVPTAGWLRLSDPPGPFTMKVLFKPGAADYRLNQPTPNPAAARVALAEAVDREWQLMKGSKGIVFEADNSYVNSAPGQQGVAPQGAGAQTAGAGPAPGAQKVVPAVDRTNYTTNYAVVDPGRWQPTDPSIKEPSIAIEVPIRHVPR